MICPSTLMCNLWPSILNGNRTIGIRLGLLLLKDLEWKSNSIDMTQNIIL